MKKFWSGGGALKILWPIEWRFRLILSLLLMLLVLSITRLRHQIKTFHVEVIECGSHKSTDSEHQHHVEQAPTGSRYSYYCIARWDHGVALIGRVFGTDCAIRGMFVGCRNETCLGCQKKEKEGTQFTCNRIASPIALCSFFSIAFQSLTKSVFVSYKL